MSTTRFQSQATGALVEDAPKLHVVTFGCQMNKYDSLLVEGRFAKQGYATTESMDDADVVLFNTCSVREHAEERTWSWLGELKRAKESRPDLVIGVMGCMAQRVEEEVFRRAGHVDIVVGTRRFQHLPEMVAERRAKRAEGGKKMARLLDTGSDGSVEVDRAAEDWVGGKHGFLAPIGGGVCGYLLGLPIVWRDLLPLSRLACLPRGPRSPLFGFSRRHLCQDDQANSFFH